MPIGAEVEQVLRDLNPWWVPPHPVRPAPPAYRRRPVPGIVSAVQSDGPSLIHVVRGPRQVGKTTALFQIVEECLAKGTPPTDVLLVRFDLQPLRECGLLAIAQWHRERIRRDAGDRPLLLLLDEIHKLERWDETVKHLDDTFRPRIVLTGSSSALVMRGQRESLAGRAVSVEFPPFLFREVLEAWQPEGVESLPDAIGFNDFFDPDFDSGGHFSSIRRQPPQRHHSWRRKLDRYYNRGGYPRLHSGEVDDDRWSDYLVETVFDRVLGVDIPDLFPVQNPGLLRHLYLEVARQTGNEVSQGTLTQQCNAAGFRTAQPVVGRYLHYLADALLVREFRRFPLARSRSARVPLKLTLTDLGVRNAIFRGAPSLWESSPQIVGPLVETLVQSVLRGTGLQVHFFRDYQNPRDRRTPIEEVDFVVEALDGRVIPVEVKFRRRVDGPDLATMGRFMGRFETPLGIVITRETYQWDRDRRILLVPLQDFLLAF